MLLHVVSGGRTRGRERNLNKRVKVQGNAGENDFVSLSLSIVFVSGIKMNDCIICLDHIFT